MNFTNQKSIVLLKALGHRYEHGVAVLSFVFLLAFGLATFSDYGISFDEPISRMNGAVSLRYVAEKFDIEWLKKDPVLQELTIPLPLYADRDYGVAFDLPAMFIERLFSLNDPREQYLLRHFLTFVSFFLAIIGLYKTAMLRFMHTGYALLACSILVTSPRIYGEAFYNNKDIVFMSLCAVSLYTLIRLQTVQTLRTAIFHGVLSALAINVRVAGIIFPILTLLTLMVPLCYRTISIQRFFLLMIGYTGTATICTYVFWPWLWENPTSHFMLALKNMAQFRWEHFNLYNGVYVYAKQLPWHYAPTWIAITVPILFTLFFLVGVVFVLARLFKHPSHSLNDKRYLQDILFLAIASGPVLATVVLNSTLYDGWRQLYFVYPAFVLLAVCGAHNITRHKLLRAKFSKLVFVLFALQITLNLSWMIRNHPYQFLYFNDLILPSIKYKFEYDYWGVTNLTGLKFILSNDARERITIKPIGATAVEQSISIIDPEDRKRLIFDPLNSSPDYLITNYRNFEGSTFAVPGNPYVIFYELLVAGRPALTIFANKEHKNNN